MRQQIKAANGTVRGFITELGDRKQIHTPNGNVLGFYSKAQDKTFKPSGTCVGFGDQLMTLLED
jgi:hypothetical protein